MMFWCGLVGVFLILDVVRGFLFFCPFVGC